MTIVYHYWSYICWALVSVFVYVSVHHYKNTLRPICSLYKVNCDERVSARSIYTHF